ncbi:MAG: helix-turn-helix transcriptional regulator, partial [Cyanobium sp.]
FLFEGFPKRLRGISSKENSPGVDTGDFTNEGYLTRWALWLGPLSELRSPGLFPSPSRAQLAAFSVSEFVGLYCAGGIGSLPQPLLGERIQAALKPNLVVVVGFGNSLNILAERHLTTVTTLRALNPTLTSLPAGFYTPETLASYLRVSLSTIYSWNSSGYGPPFVKLGNLVRYAYEDVEVWLDRQLEPSRG